MLRLALVPTVVPLVHLLRRTNLEVMGTKSKQGGVGRRGFGGLEEYVWSRGLQSSTAAKRGRGKGGE